MGDFFSVFFVWFFWKIFHVILWDRWQYPPFWSAKRRNTKRISVSFLLMQQKTKKINKKDLEIEDIKQHVFGRSIWNLFLLVFFFIFLATQMKWIKKYIWNLIWRLIVFIFFCISFFWYIYLYLFIWFLLHSVNIFF